MDLGDCISPALETLGASETESDEIKDLIQRSKDEIDAAEKAHFRSGRVTPDHIEIDTSGIREPISAIIGRFQDGIHAKLNPEAAEILVSAIRWKSYYRIDEKQFITSFEINRKPSGQLSSISPTEVRFRKCMRPLSRNDVSFIRTKSSSGTNSKPSPGSVSLSSRHRLPLR